MPGCPPVSPIRGIPARSPEGISVGLPEDRPQDLQDPGLDFRPEGKIGDPGIRKPAQIFPGANADAAKEYGSLVAVFLATR